MWFAEAFLDIGYKAWEVWMTMKKEEIGGLLQVDKKKVDKKRGEYFELYKTFL